MNNNNIWRSHLFTNFPIHPNQYQQHPSHIKESNYVDQITCYLKILRKREDLYYRMCDIEKRSQDIIDIQIHLKIIHKELDKLNLQEITHLKNINKYSELPFMNNKMQTLFLINRAIQILEITRQRLQILEYTKHLILINSQKQNLKDVYNNQAYLCNYKVINLIEEVSKHSHQRINSQFHQISRRLIILEQQSQTNNTKLITRKSLSDFPPKPGVNGNFLDILNIKRLNPHSKQKLLPSKIKADKIFLRNYSILDTKNPFYEPIHFESCSVQEFSLRMKQALNQRNVLIKQMIQIYQKEYQNYQKKRNYRIRNKKSKRQNIQDQQIQESVPPHLTSSVIFNQIVSPQKNLCNKRTLNF